MWFINVNGFLRNQLVKKNYKIHFKGYGYRKKSFEIKDKGDEIEKNFFFNIFSLDFFIVPPTIDLIVLWFKKTPKLNIYSLKIVKSQKECKTGNVGKVNILIASMLLNEIFGRKIKKFINSSKEREICGLTQRFFPVIYVIKFGRSEEFDFNKLKPIINRIISKYLILNPLKN